MYFLDRIVRVYQSRIQYAEMISIESMHNATRIELRRSDTVRALLLTTQNKDGKPVNFSLDSTCSSTFQRLAFSNGTLLLFLVHQERLLGLTTSK